MRDDQIFEFDSEPFDNNEGVTNPDPFKYGRRPEGSLSVKDLYTECATNQRHYAQCALTVRLAVVAEGLILLTGCGYTITQNENGYLVLLCIFGLTFTTLLFSMHELYERAARAGLLKAMSIESSLGLSKYGAFHAQNLWTEKQLVTKGQRLFVLHATFLSMWFAFTACGLFGVLRLIF